MKEKANAMRTSGVQQVHEDDRIAVTVIDHPVDDVMKVFTLA